MTESKQSKGMGAAHEFNQARNNLHRYKEVDLRMKLPKRTLILSTAEYRLALNGLLHFRNKRRFAGGCVFI